MEDYWKTVICNRLKNRNARELNGYQSLINFCKIIFFIFSTKIKLLLKLILYIFLFLDNKLYESSLLLRAQNSKLESQVLRGNSCGDLMLTEKISTLEQKLLMQQEELTELHRRRGENAQRSIDLNAKLQQAEKLLVDKNNRFVNITFA